MSKKLYNILMVFLPAVIILGFGIANIITKDKDYSMTERRVLASEPKLTYDNVLSGNYMEQFETYTLDQFVGRDTFRSLKALTIYYVFGQKDNHGFYTEQGHLSKLEYPMNVARIESNISDINKINEMYLKDSQCKIYFSIIPDKNYFLADDYLKIDYDIYNDTVKNGLSFANYIDIYGELSLEDYYFTDQHWKQERILPVAEKIGNAMGVDVRTDYEEITVNDKFYGAYYNQVAIPFHADELKTLTNDMLEKCTVTSYNTGVAKLASMYDMEKACGRDPYEMFLGGSDAFLTIENPNANTDRELVVFRDSFGSSLVPLLVEGYSKITVIDLRYIRPEIIGQLFEFNSQDVLFLYSSLVL